MTGDDNRQSIISIGLCHSPDGFFVSKLPGQAQIAPGFAIGNLHQCLPDPLLKIRTGQQDRQVKLPAASFEILIKLFDRAGNSVPTVLVNGNVVGAWGQHKDGTLRYDLLERITAEEQAHLEAEVARLESFLDGEYLPAGFLTPSFKALGK